MEQALGQRKISSAERSRVSSSILSHTQAAKSAEAQTERFLNACHLTASIDSLFACDNCSVAR